MKTYTEEQVEEMVQEAVAKSERSFGGTFKRLKSKNNELKTRIQNLLETLKVVANQMCDGCLQSSCICSGLYMRFLTYTPIVPCEIFKQVDKAIQQAEEE